MSELQDYFFGELNQEERARMEKQLACSEELRGELRRLEMTATALRMLPDEEPPQRIAFVSDKVFQPSLAGRAGKWLTGAVPILASAALSGLVVFAVVERRPQMTPAPAAIEHRTEVVRTPAMDQAEVKGLIATAVAAAEARNAEKMRVTLAEADRRHDMERKQMLLDVQDTMAYMQKKMNVLQVASADLGGPR
jgi:hypothetical protein